MKAAAFLFVIILSAAASGSTDPDGQQWRIKGIQKISSTLGYLYTERALYRTSDGGDSWLDISPALAPDGVVSSVLFRNERDGMVLIYESLASRIVLARTIDGGVSWTSGSADLAAFGEDTLASDAVLEASANFVSATFRVATSSNFDGSVVFRTVDAGRSWSVAKRSVELRRDDAARGTTSSDWTLVTEGSCVDTKRGCFQETALIDGHGRDITPPAVSQAMATAKQAVEAAAVNEPPRAPGGSVRTSLNRGFDKCTAATAAQMQTWWNSSPHYDANIYISGRNRGCTQAQLSAAWVDQVSRMGWGLIPTIVGYQSPCSVCTTCQKHSSDAGTAETQGRGEADIAVADAGNLGLTTGSILYYDMERYDETAQTPGCRAASTAFLKGWTERVRELGYRSGTYGSPRNAIDDWQFMPEASRMEAVWMARWDNVPSVWTYVSFANFPNNVWNNHQRIKQWQAPHDETWGGVTFNIDGNILDGPVAGVAVPKNRNADFDGDRKTDISVFRPENGIWYVLNSTTSTISYTAFGLQGDIPTPGDYDGDGRTDHSVFRPSDGGWHVLSKAGTYSGRHWGQNGDIPAAADYNGDGKTDLAVFRPSTGVWYVANSDSQGTFSYTVWGSAGDKPVVGDYDGDGKADIAVWRPSNAVWYVLRSSDQQFAIVAWGLTGDLPSQGDFDADGKTDRAIFRPSTGEWYVLQSTNAGTGYYRWGISGDLPVTGDYDGDGRDDVSIFRPSDGGWYILRSSSGFYGQYWGLGTDLAVPNAYLPR